MGRKRKPRRKPQIDYLQESPYAASPAASYAMPYEQQPGLEAVLPRSLNPAVILPIAFIILGVLLFVLCRYLGLVLGIIITTAVAAVVLFDKETSLNREILSWFQAKQTKKPPASNKRICPCCGEEMVPMLGRQQQAHKAPPNHVPPSFGVYIDEQLFTFSNAARLTNAEFEEAMDNAVKQCQRKGPEYITDNFPRLVTTGLAAIKARRQTSGSAGRYDDAYSSVSVAQYEAVQQMLHDWRRSQREQQQQEAPEQQMQWEHMQKKLRLRQQSPLLDH